MAFCGISHFSQCLVDMAVVVLVIAADISDLALECVICPFHATRLLIDVPRQDDQVDVGIDARRVEAVKFVMQV